MPVYFVSPRKYHNRSSIPWRSNLHSTDTAKAMIDIVNEEKLRGQ